MAEYDLSISGLIVQNTFWGPEITFQVRVFATLGGYEYDPLNANKPLECVGGTYDREKDRHLFDTLMRELHEETGLKPSQIIRINGAPKYSTSRMGLSQVITMRPFAYCQELKAIPPWRDLCFIVIAKDSFRPRLDKEGEVGGFLQKNALDILLLLQKNPDAFLTLHTDFYKEACREILSGRLLTGGLLYFLWWRSLQIIFQPKKSLQALVGGFKK